MGSATYRNVFHLLFCGFLGMQVFMGCGKSETIGFVVMAVDLQSLWLIWTAQLFSCGLHKYPVLLDAVVFFFLSFFFVQTSSL
jgi:hypothetical protein